MSCGQMLLFSAMERTGSTNKCGRSQARVNLNPWDLESLGKLGDCFRPLENLCYNVYPFQVVTIRFTLSNASPSYEPRATVQKFLANSSNLSSIHIF